MSRTTRLHRSWRCGAHANAAWFVIQRCADCDRAGRVFREVRDWHGWARCRPGMRRRKRHNLRSWRHYNRVQVRKGLEPEPYNREWLD